MSDVRDDSTSREYFYSLEILRGLCTFVVFFYHSLTFIAADYHPELHIDRITRGLSRLSMDAITVFFVLSGFVVAHSYRTYRDTWGPLKATPIFICARALRIWSLSVPVTLFAYFALAHYRAMHGPITLYHMNIIKDVWPSLVGYESEWNPAGWTLKFELWSYFTLPFLGLAIFARKTGLKMAGAVIGTVVFAIHCYYLWHTYYLIAEFTAGVGLYILWRRCKTGTVTLRRLGGYATFFLTAAVVLASLHAFYLINWQVARAVNAIGILLLALACEPYVDARKSTRATRSLLLLGQYSYSLYLWHYGLYEVSLVYLIGGAQIHTGHQMALFLGISFPLVVVTTFVSYHLIEKNARMSRILNLFKLKKIKASLA